MRSCLFFVLCTLSIIHSTLTTSAMHRFDRMRVEDLYAVSMDLKDYMHVVLPKIVEFKDFPENVKAALREYFTGRTVAPTRAAELPMTTQQMIKEFSNQGGGYLIYFSTHEDIEAKVSAYAQLNLQSTAGSYRNQYSSRLH